MDILALAQLPLATLVLVAAFWLLSRIWTFETGRLDDEKERLALQNRLFNHAAYNFGTMKYALQATTASLQHAKEIIEEHEAKQAKGNDTKIESQSFFDYFWPRAAPAAKKDASLEEKLIAIPDYSATEGFFDTDEIAKNLHRFDPAVGGMALVLIEGRQMAKTLLAEANALNDTTDGAQIFIGKLITLQFVFLTTALAARSVYDSTFRQTLKTAIGGKTGKDAATAMLNAAVWAMPDMNHMVDWKDLRAATPPNQQKADTSRVAKTSEAAQVKSITKPAPAPDSDRIALEFLSITDVNAPQFEAEKFRGLSVAPSAPSWLLYHSGSLLAALGLGILFFWPPAQNRLFPPDPVSCTVKFADSQVSEATCNINEDTLPQVLNSIGIEPPQ